MIDFCEVCALNDNDFSGKPTVKLIHKWILDEPAYKSLCEKHLAEEFKQEEEEQMKRNDHRQQ